MENLNHDLLQMTKMRVLIADDEAKARDYITAMLRQIPGVSICAEAVDGIEALEAIEREKPDVVLLDIQMPRLNGFEVLNELPKESIPLIIFVTGYNEYAIKAFEVSAVDYLLKPFSIDRLKQALAKTGEKIAMNAARSGEIALQQISRLKDALGQGQSSPIIRIAARCGSKLHVLSVSSIQAFLAEGSVARAVVARTAADPEVFLINRSLKDLEDRLDPNHFVRIHRRTLVNLAHLVEINPKPEGGATARLACKKELEVSRRHLPQLKEKLNS